ncbi:hypothetical protein F4779DRAFT_591787 [Xylariaceae sp. FL0662B]|nr:hypothetical protein F4779DRAFT_591787 [Xylariaceae sp. FL0662B]
MLRVLIALASALSLAFAQNDYTNQSAPFSLVLSSTVNETLNGLKLAACHAGSQTEALCIAEGGLEDPSFTTFYFNTSIPLPGQIPNDLQTGILTWLYPGGDNPTISFSQAMSIQYNAGSNLAFPIFLNTDGASVAFTAEDLMALPSSVNDALAQPVPFEGTNGVTFFDNRWAICHTYWVGYEYVALQWVLGNQSPQNPSCQSVNVKRVWV